MRSLLTCYRSICIGDLSSCTELDLEQSSKAAAVDLKELSVDLDSRSRYRFSIIDDDRSSGCFWLLKSRFEKLKL